MALGNWWRNTVQDLRFAVRQLRRTPGFAFTLVLTLALSVGVATAVFCVIDAVILRPLPYVQPDRIAFVQNVTRGGFQHPASWPDYQDQVAQLKTFQSLAGYLDFRKVTIDTPSDGPISLDSVRSTGNFFDVFGVRPFLGRTFRAGEDQDGRNDIAVLSFGAWQKYFAGDPGVIGKTVRLDGRTAEIVGVMPASFRYPLNLRNAVYTPRLLTDSWMQNRGAHWLRIVGRLKDGVTVPQAQADLVQTAANLARTYSASDQDESAQMVPLVDRVDSKTRGPLWTLLFAVLALLAIGCVNAAGLLLARGVKREREMAMRVAIGAGRQRLLGQVLTESLLMAGLGALGGVLLANLLLQGMKTFLTHALDRGADVHMNGLVLAAAVAVAALASVIASLYPALRLSGVDPNRALKSGGAAGTERAQTRLRSAFVITQVALTLVLLAVAGLLIRSVTRYRSADLGFEPAHLLTAKLELSRTRYEGRDMLTAFYAPLEERVRHLPGVESAGLINMLPIDSSGNNSYVHIAGQPPSTQVAAMLAESRFVTPGYFEAMGINLHRGRWLSAALDRPDNKASTVLVNDAFVSRFVPAGLDPVTVRMDESPKEEEWTRVVGVTGNVRQSLYEPPMPERDWLMDEIPTKYKPDLMNEMFLVARTSGDPQPLVPAIRAIVHDLDPTVPLDEPRTMTEVVSETLVLERMESWLFGIFAGLALALALVGLYGLVSHEVEQATRDIGVRMALGATRNRILQMVMSRVAWMLAAGTVSGLVLTFAARKLIGMVIYFEGQKEAGGFVLLALLLVIAGLVATLIPAVRAASIEPMQALRSE
jgi:putative ABC transport system permease protein